MNPGGLPDGHLRHQVRRIERACGLQLCSRQRRCTAGSARTRGDANVSAFWQSAGQDPTGQGGVAWDLGKTRSRPCLDPRALRLPRRSPPGGAQVSAPRSRSAALPAARTQKSSRAGRRLGRSVAALRSPSRTTTLRPPCPHPRRRADSEKENPAGNDGSPRQRARARRLRGGCCARAPASSRPRAIEFVSKTCAFQVPISFGRTRLKADFIFAGGTRNHK